MLTNITFRLESDTDVLLIRNGRPIGRIWSEQSGETLPFPHNKNIKTINSVQLCGFDSQSETWACGPFEGKRDACFYFNDTDNAPIQLSHYKTYVERCIANDNIALIKNFNDWSLHNW